MLKGKGSKSYDGTKKLTYMHKYMNLENITLIVLAAE